MKKNINPYEPCPCGSGKKYKFCCYQKRDEALSRKGTLLSTTPLPSFLSNFIDGFSEKAFQLLKEGVQLMNKGDCRGAIPLFKRSLVEMPGFSPSANNLSICLFNIGQLDEAISVLKENLETCPVPNVFGLATLASFFHVKGDEFSAQRYLKEALDSEILSEDTCIKVCEVLARFKRHQDILGFVEDTEYYNDTTVCFYTGIAAANLDDTERAINDLRKVPVGYHKAFMAQRYLENLREGTKPHTLCKDWPYLLPDEICPFEVIDDYVKKDFEGWKTNAFSATYCEAMLNETAADPEIAMTLLASLEHPRATHLLWAIVKGDFGPDVIRLEALNVLKESGALGEKKSMEILLDGERREISLIRTKLNSDFRFSEPLMKKFSQKYIKAIKQMEGSNPDYDFIDKTYAQIMREQPDYYPVKFNYAVALYRRGYLDQALSLIREIVANHPEYLFARCTLLQTFLGQDQIEEAEELIASTPDIEETHPDAMAAWMIGQVYYHEYCENFDKAREYTLAAHDIAPYLKAVKIMWEHYGCEVE